MLRISVWNFRDSIRASTNRYLSNEIACTKIIPTWLSNVPFLKSLCFSVSVRTSNECVSSDSGRLDTWQVASGTYRFDGDELLQGETVKINPRSLIVEHKPSAEANNTSFSSRAEIFSISTKMRCNLLWAGVRPDLTIRTISKLSTYSNYEFIV